MNRFTIQDGMNCYKIVAEDGSVTATIAKDEKGLDLLTALKLGVHQFAHHRVEFVDQRAEAQPK